MKQFLLLVMIVSLGISWNLSTATADNNPAARIAVDGPDQACVADEDCVLIRTKCLPCECDTAVHKDYLIKYQQLIQGECAKFPAAAACEIPCKKPLARCVEGECDRVEK